jgi:hypothetical protein
MRRDPFEQLFESLDRTRNITDSQIDELFSVESLNSIAYTPTRRRRGGRLGKRLLRRGTVVATVAVLLVGSAAAAITLTRGPVETVTSMTCYQHDSLRSTANVVSYSSTPLAFCSQLLRWPTSSDPHDEGSLCLLSNGSLAAFPPSRKFQGCKALGLEEFNGRLANPDAAKFELAAENYFSRHQCEARAKARGAILQLMGTNGLVGWTVRLTGSSSPKACATLAILTSSQEVNIVGIRP